MHTTQHTTQLVKQYSSSKRAAALLLRNAQACAALAHALALVQTAHNCAQLMLAYNAAAQLLARSVGDVALHALAQRVLANYVRVQFAVVD